jgi:hypothetical protein
MGGTGHLTQARSADARSTQFTPSKAALQCNWPTSLRNLVQVPLSLVLFVCRHANTAMSPCSTVLLQSRCTSPRQALSPRSRSL